MIHMIVEVSDADELVIVNEVPAVRAEQRSQPGVPPSDWLKAMIRLVEVTDVLETVTAPPERVATPILALVPSLTRKPLPARPATMSESGEPIWADAIRPQVLSRPAVPGPICIWPLPRRRQRSKASVPPTLPASAVLLEAD